MRITIKGRQVRLHRDTVNTMQRRLHFSLSRFDHSIHGVTVRLTDVNGPKGGYDKECLIVVRLRQGGEVMVQGTGTDCGAVLNHCADRISRAVGRELDRRKRAPIRAVRRRQSAEKDSAAAEQNEVMQ